MKYLGGVWERPAGVWRRPGRGRIGWRPESLGMHLVCSKMSEECRGWSRGWGHDIILPKDLTTDAGWRWCKALSSLRALRKDRLYFLGCSQLSCAGWRWADRGHSKSMGSGACCLKHFGWEWGRMLVWVMVAADEKWPSSESTEPRHCWGQIQGEIKEKTVMEAPSSLTWKPKEVS